MKIHYISSHSNLQNHHLSILSMIIEWLNINVIFSIFLHNESLLSFMMNILWASEIAKLLKIYLNQCFVDILMFITILNAWIDCQNHFFHKTQRFNHFSIFNHSKIINESIQIDFQKKWIIQISNLSSNYFYFSIDFISKLMNDKSKFVISSRIYYFLLKEKWTCIISESNSNPRYIII